MARWFLVAIIGAFVAQTLANIPQLEKVAPLVWQKSSLTPITGYEYRTHVFSFGRPCLVFGNAGLEYDKCRKERFGEKLAEAMKHFCPEVESLKVMPNQDLKKQSRPFFNEIHSSISAIVTKKLPIESMKYWSPNSSWTPENLKKQIDEIFNVNEASQDREIFNKSMSIWGNLRDDSNSSKLDKMNNFMKLYEENFVRLLGGVKDGIVDKVYHDIFPNITENPVSVNLWSFEKCFTLPKKSKVPDYDGKLVFWLKIPIRADGVKILKSKKFNIVKQENNQQCLYSYDQKESLIYDLKHECLKEFDETSIINNKMVLFSSDLANCPTLDKPETKWTKKHCYDVIHPLRYRQRMEDATHHYIYCLNQIMIVLGYDKMKCENVIYRIPHTQQFWLDGEEIKNGNFYHEPEFEIEHNFTDFLNEQTFIRTFGDPQKFEDLGDIITTEQEMNHSLVLEYVFNHPLTMLTLAFNILLIVGVFVVLFIILQKMYFHYLYKKDIKERFRVGTAEETGAIVARDDNNNRINISLPFFSFNQTIPKVPTSSSVSEDIYSAENARSMVSSDPVEQC